VNAAYAKARATGTPRPRRQPAGVRAALGGARCTGRRRPSRQRPRSVANWLAGARAIAARLSGCEIAGRSRRGLARRVELRNEGVWRTVITELLKRASRSWTLKPAARHLAWNPRDRQCAADRATAGIDGAFYELRRASICPRSSRVPLRSHIHRHRTPPAALIYELPRIRSAFRSSCPTSNRVTVSNATQIACHALEDVDRRCSRYEWLRRRPLQMTRGWRIDYKDCSGRRSRHGSEGAWTFTGRFGRHARLRSDVT